MAFTRADLAMGRGRNALPDPASTAPPELTPAVRRLLGSGVGGGDRDDYRWYLEEKYRSADPAVHGAGIAPGQRTRYHLPLPVLAQMEDRHRAHGPDLAHRSPEFTVDD